MDKDQTIRVLIINTVPTERNGITNVIFNLFDAMDKSNMQIDMVAINTPPKEYENKIEFSGGKLYVLERSIKHPFKYKRQLSKLIRENKYAIVHAHGNSHTLALEMAAAKDGGCSVRIAHAHSTGCKHKILHKLLGGIFLKNVTIGIACGKEAGKFLFGKREFAIINNGIALDRFIFNKNDSDCIRKELGLKDKKVVGHVGSFVPVKNHMFLIDILKALLKKDPTYQLVLVGDGPLKQEILNKSNNLGIENSVVCVGPKSNVESYLSAFDVFIMPSLFEGMPLSLIEAQANGLRCFASCKIPVEANVSNNVTFLKLEEGAEVWAETISHQFIDINKRIERSREACQKITLAGFDIFSEAMKLKNIYMNALNGTHEEIA